MTNCSREEVSSIQASTTKASYHEAARRPPLQCIVEGQSVANPGQLILAGKVKEEFLDSARRGHEDEGGEGTFGGIRVAPEGLNFFSEHLFVMEFTFTFTSENEV